MLRRGPRMNAAAEALLYVHCRDQPCSQRIQRDRKSISLVQTPRLDFGSSQVILGRLAGWRNLWRVLAR